MGSDLKQSSVSAKREGDPFLPSPAISPRSDLRKKKKDDVIPLFEEYLFGHVSPTQTEILYLPDPLGLLRNL